MTRYSFSATAPCPIKNAPATVTAAKNSAVNSEIQASGLLPDRAKAIAEAKAI